MAFNVPSDIKAALAAQSPLEKLAATVSGAKGAALSNLDNMLASFASAFTQNNRLLKLKIDDGKQYAEHLLPQIVQGTERLSDTYKYEVTCLSPDAFIPLDELLGQSAQLDIITGNPSKFGADLEGPQDVTRCGLITAAEALPSDGGFAKYLLTVESPLAPLRHRFTSRVFQDITVPDIVRQILEEHIGANPAIGAMLKLKFDLVRQYEQRSYCLQYRESDLAFIERILFEEGLPYRFTHEPGDVPTVTFTVFDDPYSLPQATQGTIRFHRTDATEAKDAITEWVEDRQIGPVAVSLICFDYKPVVIHDITEETHIDQDMGAAAEVSLEDYDPQGPYYGKNLSDLNRYATRRQEAHDFEKGGFSAQGNVRQLKAGEWFLLTQHPRFNHLLAQEECEFLAYEVRFTVHNNLPIELRQCLEAQKTGEPAPKPYWMHIKTRRRGQPLTPAYGHTSHAKPTAPGPQTALVVGPKGEEEVYTDEMGRIKVQFHWQRPKEHAEYGANMDERSSCWVRVAYPSAGAHWGSQYIPRVGQEVIVDYVEDDIDRPIVTGVIHNGHQPNPWFSDAGSLPANRTLSGIKTKEFYGQQYGELLFDDTQNEIRVKLSSEHGKTQANLGFLIHPRRDGEGQPRGEGAELRTDRQLAVRAAHGLLLTTEPKPRAGGKQIARELALEQLEAARETAQMLADDAKGQKADVVEMGPDTRDEEGAPESTSWEEHPEGHLDHMVEAIVAWEAETNTDHKAETAEKDQPGRQPVLLASSVEGIAFATPQEMVLTSGRNLDTITLRDTQQTTLRRWIHNAGKKISLYVHGIANKFNLKLVTAQGDAQLYAQSGDVEVTADKNVTITANKETLTAAAGKEFLVACGGGYIKISGGKIDVHCPGILSIKAGSHSYQGGASMNVKMPVFPTSELELEAPETEILKLKGGYGRTVLLGGNSSAGESKSPSLVYSYPGLPGAGQRFSGPPPVQLPPEEEGYLLDFST